MNIQQLTVSSIALDRALAVVTFRPDREPQLVAALERIATDAAEYLKERRVEADFYV